MHISIIALWHKIQKKNRRPDIVFIPWENKKERTGYTDYACDKWHDPWLVLSLMAKNKYMKKARILVNYKKRQKQYIE